MNKQLIGWTATLGLALGAHVAMADSIPFSEDFNTVVTATQSNFGNWTVSGGNVDTISYNDGGAQFFGLTCRGGAGGCVDLDGSGQASTGVLLQSGTFNLLAGHTYQLTAWASGDQRNGAADNLALGFADAAGTNAFVGGFTQILGIASNSPYTLYTALFTPGANVAARLFFFNGIVVGGGAASDSLGPLLDDIQVSDITAVPLPASAWLLLTGLLALGVISRRKTGSPFAV